MLEHLGLASRLRGSGPQRRGPCPLHRGDGRGRTFGVNREAHVFHCFGKGCGKEGDVFTFLMKIENLSKDLDTTAMTEVTGGTALTSQVVPTNVQSNALEQAFNIKTVGDLGKNKYFRAAQLLADCPCEAGCPSCVGPIGEVGGRGKLAARRILAELLG